MTNKLKLASLTMLLAFSGVMIFITFKSCTAVRKQPSFVEQPEMTEQEKERIEKLVGLKP